MSSKFEVVTEVVYGSLPTIRKAADTIICTWWCWSVPPRAELTIKCLLCLQIFSRAMSASVWESDRKCTNSFTVHRLSSCVYCSVTATGMSVWTDTGRPLQCLAVNTLPLPNACTHLETVRYGMARSSAASCSSAWYSNAFFCTDNCYFHYKHCSTSEISFSEWDR